MPARSEFSMQPEIGVLGLREARRSDSVICRGAPGAAGAAGRPSARCRGTGGHGMRTARGSASENINPSIGTVGTGANGRRSPRIGSCSGSSNSRPLAAYAAGRQQSGGPLGDITNVSAARADKALQAKPVKQPPSAPAAPAPAAPAPRAAPAPAPAPVPAAEVAALQELGASEEVQKAHETAEAVIEAEAINVQKVQEYVEDIYDGLFREETLFAPRPNYMESQTDVTGKMRTILIDWLVEVHMKYQLRSETLHLTVNLIDRYLTRMPVMRKRLQLVGVVAMFIASKFEEISPPELHEWVYITDNAYSQNDLLVMECTMLTTLSFQIMVPTAAHFFEGFQKANGCDRVHREIAQYLLELTLLDIRMLQYTPSQLVAAALLVSNELLKRSQVWPATMAQQTRHSEASLGGCAEELRRLCESDRAAAAGGQQPGQLQAVHKKFADPRRHAVSKKTFSP